MKKTLTLLVSLALTFYNGDNLPGKGDSILNDAILVCGYVNNHCLIYCHKDSDPDHLKFGFVHARILDFRIAVEPEYEDVYTCAGYNEGCLIWVKKGNKWAVFDIDSYEVISEFKYDKISDFREKSINNESHKGIYEAEVERDGKRESIQIEKYLCCSYYEY